MQNIIRCPRCGEELIFPENVKIDQEFQCMHCHGKLIVNLVVK